MSDPAGGGFSGIGDFVKEHQTATVVIGGGVALVFVWYFFSSSSTPAPAAATTTVDPTADAAAIQAAQVSANSQTALATVAAGVTNNQTAAAQTVALAQLQTTTQSNVAASAAASSSAYYGAATEIAGANSAVAIADSQAQQVEQTSQNNLLASEFGSLASVLSGYGTAIQSMVNSNTAAGVAFGGQAASVASSANAASAAASAASASDISSLESLIASPMFSYGAPGGWLNQQTYGNQQPWLTSELQTLVAGGVGSGVSGGGADGGLAAIAGSTTATAASSTAAASGTFLSFMSGLLGAFNVSSTASAPKTAAPSALDIANTNLRPLAGGPSLPSLASLAAFSN